jgi:hypothetical protein
VLPGWPVPPANVTTGGLNAGVFALGASVVVIVAACWEASQAETRNEMVPPGVTLVAEAETVTAGFAGTGEPLSLSLSLPVGDGDGARQVGDGDGDGDELCQPSPLRRCEEAAEVPDELAPCTDHLSATGPDADADADDTAADADTAADDAAVGAGVAEADGAMARTKAVAPLKLTKRPVARTSVAGRARLDCMNIPSIDAVRAESMVYEAFVAVGRADCAKLRISPGCPTFRRWGPRSGACRRARPPARRRWLR